MKVIGEQLIEEKTYTDSLSKYKTLDEKKKFSLFLLLSFWDCSSTEILRLFSGNLAAVFSDFAPLLFILPRIIFVVLSRNLLP